ncbi:hypothetical protein [Paenibacillus spongiae]|uniref:Flp pilus-assembly TadG-like N-terminal domain-containing protein n=1 Tax=Paenibacillus spongiae TaxID=2909671 RepID=A0ABY5SGN6_9BACL|nr:hypothetical protein [Paenibacillus spongiae]UVI31423.1 hypothetical protein L1F29_06260 [Paenibacillus spongiae]
MGQLLQDHKKRRRRRRRENWIFRILTGQEGAVSIYLIVSTAAIFMFTSMLIDYARVAAFQKQVELAAQSGIRSSLSAFDGALYERYGLFGTGGSDRNEIFAHAAKNNWDAREDDAFRVLNIRLDASHVNAYETLGRHDVFKRQVLEEMKYKAPIDFTLEVASKLAPMASAMKEASAAVEMLEQLRKLYDRREKHLQTALALQREMAQSTAAPAALIPIRAQDAIGTDTVMTVISGYESYAAWVEHDSNLGEDAVPVYTKEISAYELMARTVSSGLRSKSSAALRRHQELEHKAMKEVLDAERCNDEMRIVIEKSRQEQQNSGYDRLNKQKIPGGKPGALQEEELSHIGQAASSTEQLLMQSESFAAYRDEISKQTAVYASFDSETASFQSSISIALSRSGSAVLLAEDAAQLRIAFEQYDQQYGTAGSVITARASEQEARQANDAERKKQEAKAKSKWNEVRRLLHGITSVPQLREHQEMFNEAKRLYETNLTFNRTAVEARESIESSGDPGDAVDEAMGSVGTIFTGIADMLEGIRDPLYVNEYIVHRFATFDPRKFEAIIHNNDGGEFANALSLNNQEAEYILYGLHDPAGNVAAAYGEVFAVRLAIRTMEGLIECRAMGHPLLVLASAILYGLEKAIEDMLTLARTGATPLSKYATVDVTYRDYLRLFLLLHGGGVQRLSRMIAVIESNTGMTLSTTSTGLSGELQASVNLWFLPGLMKGFTRFGILGGKVKGSRYETTKTIGWSYG